MSFSIWHWLTTLVVLLAIPLAIAAVGARLNNGSRHMGRLAFAARVIGIWVAVIVLGVALTEVKGSWRLISLPLVVLPVGLVAYLAVDRLRDMGASSKKLAVLTALPIVGWFIVIYLMAASPTSPADRRA